MTKPVTSNSQPNYLLKAEEESEKDIYLPDVEMAKKLLEAGKKLTTLRNG